MKLHHGDRPDEQRMNKNNAWLGKSYRFNATLNLWHRGEQPVSPAASDAADEWVARTLRESFDRSSLSLELQKAAPDGAASEDFSPRRANLLRPFRHLLKGTILEIGAGSGSLTRFLGEAGGEVVAIEKNPWRAAAAAARCVDLPNVSVVADDFASLPAALRFDVVTLIDSAGLSQGSPDPSDLDPVAALIARARNFLRPGGLLFVAIENQVGLTYLAGSESGRASEPDSAAEDRGSKDGLATFGRTELSLRLADSGLLHQQWWFPLPDHRLPVAILSDRALHHGVDLSALIGAALRSDPRGRRHAAFSRGRAWKPVFRNGLWADLADSFLVVSSDEALPGHDVLAVHYGAPRRPAFAKELKFLWRNGAAVVQRSLFYPEAAATRSGFINVRVAEEPFETAPSWHAELAALTARPGWTLEAWIGWARRWFDAALFAAAMPPHPLPAPSATISGGLIDAIPRNMVAETTTNARFFDQEWEMEEPIEIGFLVYRGLFDSLDALVDCAEPARGVSLSKMALFQHFIRSLGWQLTADDIRRYADFENRIRAEIQDRDERPLSQLHDPVPVDAGVRLLPSSPVRSLRREIADARSKVARLSDSLKARDKERQLANGKIAELEKNLKQEEEANRESREELAAMRATGDRLVWELRRAYSKPWHPAQLGLQRVALRTLLLLKPLLPARNVCLFQTSLQKRKPVRFQLEWDAARLAQRPSGPDQLRYDDERDIALIEASDLFDASFYEGTANALALGMSPVAHYVKYGEASGLSPSAAFDPDFYKRLYPDVTEGRLSHYLMFGRNEGRSAVPAAGRMQFPAGTIDPRRQTVLVMVHEASRTGAPILAWNIVRAISRKYNVVVVLQQPGSLFAAFEQAANVTVKLPDGFLPFEAEYEELARALIGHYKLEYVIANSVETRGAVPEFERHGIPVVALVHEFSSYYRPIGRLAALFEHASQVVFPAQVVADAALDDHRNILPRRYTILPQGSSELPFDAAEAPAPNPQILKRPSLPEQGDASALPPRDGTLFVVGMGAISMRKGVDSFIAAAADVARRRPDLKVKFAWAGEAYTYDQSYFDFIEAQVERSGLGDRFSFLGAFNDMEPLYERTDIMVLSSRLDPLPNVSIDCALHGIPVLCFENASGMAEILLKRPDTRQLVVPYLDSGALAERLIDLATDPDLRKTLSAALREIGESTFDMQGYVRALDELAQSSLQIHRQARLDFETIKDAGVFNSTLYQTGALTQLGEQDALQHYLQASRNAIPRGEPLAGHFVRRPVEGFHPLVYAAENADYHEATGEDPLAHYLRSGRPSGTWRHNVIIPQARAGRSASRLKVAIHGHFHYPELLPEFVERLSQSATHCELLITTTSDERQVEIERSLSALGVAGTVVTVPNKGRDIGPFLTAFPRERIFSYDLIGHFHGKRSLHGGGSLGDVWRTFLWEHLVGGKFPMVDEIAAAFRADPELGLVFAEDPYLWDWNDNRAIAEGLAARMGITLSNHFDFPLGTMFWARPAALAPLFDLDLTWEDYPSEPLPIDGTLLHSLERMLPFAARKAGYDYATTYIREFRR
ncbi:glycosyltransferase [Mesorhizobium sp. BR1-1-16]|uniref:rhamnan synthesis F family protein n=1 Tax=Mesorhizobium sp. BR1-1-16 TaxID=2876653 RepID=UPI001CCA8CBE|nr:rhamnan synthesis F family protein [Mesorhizobium sp. BR1-1-16]MBZ9937684.1 glycosyltransferase [Mesorhizobium sp. BR1-1-16]